MKCFLLIGAILILIPLSVFLILLMVKYFRLRFAYNDNAALNIPTIIFNVLNESGVPVKDKVHSYGYTLKRPKKNKEEAFIQCKDMIAKDVITLTCAGGEVGMPFETIIKDIKFGDDSTIMNEKIRNNMYSFFKEKNIPVKSRTKYGK